MTGIGPSVLLFPAAGGAATPGPCPLRCMSTTTRTTAAMMTTKAMMIPAIAPPDRPEAEEEEDAAGAGDGDAPLTTDESAAVAGVVTVTDEAGTPVASAAAVTKEPSAAPMGDVPELAEAAVELRRGAMAPRRAATAGIVLGAAAAAVPAEDDGAVYATLRTVLIVVPAVARARAPKSARRRAR